MACLSRLFRQSTVLLHRKYFVPRGPLHFSTSTLKMQLDLSGIYPPIATPFNKDETIAYDKLESNMNIWNKIPFRGLDSYASIVVLRFLKEQRHVLHISALCNTYATDHLSCPLLRG